ncbi:hypothetical protein HDE_04017 [Halotydeus destructor]|nr:hypothetical protein HDE_04017 [Halotydeus destructor]
MFKPKMMMYGEQVVMAYPTADGIFFSVIDPPDSQKPSCCSTEHRIKPNNFRYYPTAAELPDAVTEIGSGSACQNLFYRCFKIILFIWTALSFIFMGLMLFLGIYYYDEFKERPEEKEEIIRSNPFFTAILENGPIVVFFVSFILLLVPCLGFFGAYKENTWLLITFGILIVVNSIVKMMNPPINPFLGFAATLFVVIIPFVLAVMINKRMSRAI